MFPVRCFSCGKVLDERRYRYLTEQRLIPLEELKDEKERYLAEPSFRRTPKEALDEMNLNRICCRRMYLSHDFKLEERILHVSALMKK